MAGCTILRQSIGLSHPGSFPGGHRRTVVILFGLAGLLVALAASPPGMLGEDLIPMPTMGGQQFWSDELFFHQWRIQQNSLLHHFRLLDGNGMRHASGSYDQCLAVLQGIKRKRNLPPMEGKAVIVLHGLGRSHSNMETMAKYLRDKGGYTVFNVTYPSMQRDVGQHALSLAHIIENLDGITEINFVAHSLGNLVVRHYLGDQTDPQHGHWPDRRIRRFVMLGPPNQGSIIAAMLADNKIFEFVAGPSGQQLGAQWAQIRPHLVTPACEFGIIAGGTQFDKGFNPLLKEDNDGLVTVESTKLAGAADFLAPAADSYPPGRRSPCHAVCLPLPAARLFPIRRRPAAAEVGTINAEASKTTAF